MNRTFIIILSVILIGGTGFAIGFFTGVNEGIKQYFLIESSVKASLLTHELRSLREGDVETNLTTKEIELDGEVVKYFHFLREGRPWVFWFLGGYERDHAKYMTNVASYRKEHPPIMPTIEYGKENTMKDEMEKFKKDVVEATDEMLNEYGK